ncbi:MAG: hypothetical protein HFF50_03290 [Lawsonibacter sp.]|nr:hypothetical protein [Lawsonibacter sp.]
MTDIQFNAFVRFLLDALYATEAEENPVMQETRFKRIISNLEKILDD